MRSNVIGSAVGGLIVTLTLWAIGKLGVVWQALWSAVWWIGRQLAASIPVPAWLILLIAGYVISLTVILRRRRAPPPPSVGPDVIARVDGPVSRHELDRFEVKVIRGLAEADGAALAIDELADDLNVSQLRLEQTLEHLEAIGYMEIDREVEDGPVVDVTRAGRDYMIEKGMV